MPASGRFIPTARLIALLTLGSRLLGLVRECVFAWYFGTSEVLSAFRIAFMAPNLARRLFGEGALSSAMIPVLTESLATQGEVSSRRFVGTLLVVLGVVLGGVVLGIEALIALSRTVRDDPALELAAVLMPYMALICVVAIVGGVLNVRRHFATTAAAPMILNVGIIAAALIGARVLGLEGIELAYAVCLGVLAAGVVQLALSFVALKAVSFFPIFGGSWRDPQIRAVCALMGPMVLGLSAVQINTLADHLIAYVFIIVDGERVGPAVLGFAQYLYQLPLGVFGIALATAIFPVMSKRFADQDRVGLAETLAGGVRLSLFVGLPASIGLLFVAHPLVETLYQRFTAAETQRVAGVLVFYSLGLPAYFLQHILVRTFYAMKESRTPARIALTMVAINLVMNLILVRFMEERGLALATAICAAIQFVWLLRLLRGTLPEISGVAIAPVVIRIILATLAMTAALFGLVLILRSFAPTAVAPVRLAMLVATGVAVYALSAHLLKISELQTLLHRKS